MTHAATYCCSFWFWGFLQIPCPVPTGKQGECGGCHRSLGAWPGSGRHHLCQHSTHRYGAEHVQINTDVLNTHYVLSAGFLERRPARPYRPHEPSLPLPLPPTWPCPLGGWWVSESSVLPAPRPGWRRRWHLGGARGPWPLWCTAVNSLQRWVFYSCV